MLPILKYFMMVNSELDTYGPIFLGFFSLEFLDGWISITLGFASTVLVIMKIVKMVKDWNK